MTDSLLRELGCEGRPIITVFNKCDLVGDPLALPGDRDSVRISAKNGIGIEELLKKIEENLPVKLRSYKLLLPFDKAGLIAVLRNAGALRSEEYTDKGIEVEAVVEEPMWHMVDEYRI